MAVKLRRPILVGGLGLTFSVWLLDSFSHSVGELSGSALLAAIAAGSGVLWWRQQVKKPLNLSLTSPPDRAAVEKAIAAVEESINYLATEVQDTESNTEETQLQVDALREQLTRLTDELDRKEIRLAVLGGRATGKTALVRLLESAWVPLASAQLSLKDTEALFALDDINQDTVLAEVQSADLALFVTAGDLTESEFQVLQQLAAQQQRLVLVFNKQDQYLPIERPTILQQLRERMRETLAEQDIVAIAAVPKPLKVRQYQADGSIQERMEQPDPDIALLTEQLSHILTHERSQLVLSTIMRRATSLKVEVQSQLNGIRRDRALPIIEQSQWIAAATAFANPVPVLDLLATAAISGQLIMDLGEIYHQKFSLQQAKAIAGTMASLMIKLGLVEFSTQTVSAVLKSNTVTFVAGGLLQGASAAYLTRLAGLSLVEYFQEQSGAINPTEAPLQLERLGQKLQAVFQQNQQVAFLQSLIKQVITRQTTAGAPVLSGVTAEPLHLVSQESNLLGDNEATVSLSISP